MKRSNRFVRGWVVFSLCVAASVIFRAGPVQADVLIWDVSPGDGGKISDGTGNWTQGAGNWNSGAGDATWNNATPDGAYIGAGGTAGTISLTSGITVSNITFNAVAGSYTVQNSTLTLSGTPTITANADAAISSILDGSGFSKDGNRMLTLSGANTFAGAVTLNAGALRAKTSAQALGSGAATLDLRGGALDLAHSTGLAFNRDTTVNADASIITERDAVGAGVTYTLGTLNINGAYTLTIRAGNVNSGTAGLTFGATTLNGSATIDTWNPTVTSSSGAGPGNVVLTLGPVSGSGYSLTKNGLGALQSLETSGTPFGDGGILLNGGTLVIAPGTAGGNAVSGVNADAGSTFTYLSGMLQLTQNGAGLDYTIGNAGAAPNSVVSRASRGTMVLGLTALSNLQATERFIVSAQTSASNKDGAGSGSGIYDASLVAQEGSGNNGVGSFVAADTAGNGGFKLAAYTTAIDGAAIAANTISDVSGSISVNDGSNPYALRVGAVTLTNSGTTTVNGGAAGASNSGLGGVILNPTATASTITGGTLAFGSSEGVVYVGSGAGGATIASAITGSAGLTKFGPGTLRLSNASNSYTGGTVINGGTLYIINEAELGSASSITINGGSTLQLGDASSNSGLSSSRGIVVGPGIQNIVKGSRKTVNINGVISGVGGVSFGDPTAWAGDGGGGGRFQINGANTYTGDTIITYAGGWDPGIVVNNALALQNTTLDYSTLNIPNAWAGSMVMWGVANPILGGLKGNRAWNISYQSNPGNLKIGNNNQDTIFSGSISSSSPATQLTKIGTGTLVLSANNTYTGSTTVEAGTLVLAGANASATMTINGGVLRAGSATSFGPAAAASLIFGPGSAGAVQLNGNSMTVIRLESNATPGTPTVENASLPAATLTVNNSADYTYAGALGDGAGGGSLALTKNGGGALTLSGSSTHSGGIIVNGGTLTLSGTSGYSGTTTVNFGSSLFVSGADASPSNSILTVNAGGTVSLADGTARSNAVGGLNLANANLAFDWKDGAVDTLTTAAAATSAGTISISLNLAGAPGGTDLPLIHAASGLAAARYILAANATFTATLTVTDTDVRIGNFTTVTALTNAYWYGGQLSNAPNAMALSDATIGNWSSDATYTPTALVPGGACDVFFSTTSGATQQSNIVLGANMTVNSLTFNDATPVTIADDGFALTLSSTNTGAASALNVNQPATINAAIAGAGSPLAKSGAGTLTLAGTNRFSGQLAVKAGTLAIPTINNAAAFGPLGNSANAVILGDAGGVSGTLQYTGATAGSDKKFTMATGGTGVFQVDAGATTLTLSGVISGGGMLVKTNAGTLRLTAANTYTGGTVVTGGTLSINDQPAVNSKNVTLDGGTLLLDNGGTYPQITVGAGGGTLSNNGTHTGGGHMHFPNDIIGTGNLYYYGWGDDRFNTVGGRGAFSLFGDFVVMDVQDGMKLGASFPNSTLDLRDPVTAGQGNTANPVWGGLKGTSALALSDYTGTLSIGNNNKDTIYSGVMSGSLPWAKIGTGTLTLSGTNTYTGYTTVSNGTLALAASGSISNSPAIRIGAGARFDVSAKNSYSMSTNQTFTFDIDPTGAGSAGRIVAAGLDVAAGKVAFNVVSDTCDDPVYVLADCTSLTGVRFSSVTGLPAGYAIEYGANRIALVRARAALLLIR